MSKSKQARAPKKNGVSLVRSSAAECLTFADNELERGATVKQYLIVQTEGVNGV